MRLPYSKPILKVRKVTVDLFMTVFPEDFEMDNVDLVNIDVTDLGPDWKQRLDSWSSYFTFMGCLTLKYVKFFHVRVDTVVMNPPFGTKHNKGLDMKFLQVGNHCVFLLMHLFLDWLGNGLQSCVFTPQKFNQRSCLVQGKGVGGRRKVRQIRYASLKKCNFLCLKSRVLSVAGCSRS